MKSIKKALTIYFVYYGVASFLNNLATHLIQTKAIRAKLEERDRIAHPTAHKHNHRGYM